MKTKYLFIDRDGTLIDEPDGNFQIDSMSKLKFKKNVILALSELSNLDYTLIMVTNQDGLGTASFPLEKFNQPHLFMLHIFDSEGITFDDVLICPHLINDHCKCRKPKIHMIKPWLKKIDPLHSYVIGDRETDMILAKNLGISGIQYKEKMFDWIQIKNAIIKKNRYAQVIRNTKETQINVQVFLDSEENSEISTGINFFDHMLEQLSVHSGICMKISAIGDLNVDDHHTVEDSGIALGEALLQALGSKHGLSRFGFYVPMDESVSHCIIDISNRPYLKFQSTFHYQMVGDLNTAMIEHFFYSLVYSMRITLHLNARGKNDHHCAESLFKSFGCALRQAISVQGTKLPTSKGML
jgi:imidazoleglycerol-phosphate dehydratase/histidinol-phosphatase